MDTYCNWEKATDLDRLYHDNEWGIPVHDDLTQFEFLMLEAMQCGLSWQIILKKRQILRDCFDGFDFRKIALYDESDVMRILSVDGMIKSKSKILATISNARCFLSIVSEYGSFSEYIWGFSGNKTLIYKEHAINGMPSKNHLSEQISRDLKKRGFKYLGPVTVYSYLQGCGIINDHDPNCPCYKKICSCYPIEFAEGM